jgi:DNA polymerase I-like protein with 3'-5' exonuclease and polymerase domains
MNVLTFDVETTHKEKPNGQTTPLPFFGNDLVSIGYKWLDETQVFYDCYYHSTQSPSANAAEDFQTALNYADILVGHNIKFDLMWIRECGFVYEGAIYDTMVAEYILSRSRHWPLGLADVAEKYGGTKKEKDLIKPYFKQGKTFYDIPWEIIVEYGVADVIATEEIALKQLEIYGTTFEELFNEQPRLDTDVASVS